ncbi:hypothetical protein AAGV28_01745 [Flavobacterium sp. FZUC8N2.13]|uniref:Uncharacterized protein n=1 Tax=Flavobacterium zubiriense TaxID=3138075 RepID=A0ABV4T7W2_9FLAO
MTPEQYDRIIQNQIIIDKKLDRVLDDLVTMKNDIKVSLNNQILLEEYQMDIVNRLKRIENKK